MHNPGKQRGRMSGDIRPHSFVACLTADRRLAAGRGPGASGRGADARRERNRGDPVSPAGSRLGKFVALDLITSQSDATGQWG